MKLVVLLAAVSLSGCASTDVPPLPSELNPPLTPEEKKSISICNFEVDTLLAGTAYFGNLDYSFRKKELMSSCLPVKGISGDRLYGIVKSLL